jgi:hypothetical protein
MFEYEKQIIEISNVANMTKKELDNLKQVVINLQDYDSVKKLNKSLEWKNNKNRLKDYSLSGKNVLVIGSEAILRQDFPSEKFDDYEILNQANGDTELLLLEYLKRKDEDAYGRMEHLADATKSASFYQDVDDILKEMDDEWRGRAIDMLDPSLRLLLESKCFRLVITTVFDPILEYALRVIWGKDLKIKNIHDYDISATDIKTEENRKSEFYDINPTLYYAFGKSVAGNPGSCYAITDDKKIYTIDCWLSSRKPDNLLQYILDRNIIAIGCKFDNWVFRFIWYLLGKKPAMSAYTFSSEVTPKEGSVAIMLADDGEDKKTRNFIKRSRINYFDDSRAFMTLLAPVLLPETVPEIGTYFISYASENFSTANIIYNFLINQKQRVWFDIRLKAGDRFDTDITKGISQCDVFMPILSNQTKSDLISNNRRYYRDEWDLANKKYQEIKNFNKDKKDKEKRKFLVIPIIIEDYSVSDSSYHNKELVTECIKGATCFKIEEHPSLNDLTAAAEQGLSR